MKKLILMSVVAVLAFSMVAVSAQAQTKKGKAADKKAEAPVAAVESEEPAAPAPVPENGLEVCKDSVDNDQDGHVDCADQDCGIFAMCVTAPKAEAPQEPVPVRVIEVIRDRKPQHETGRLCRDGIDNNGDGLIDCFEESCQGYRYCKKKMYYIPEPDDKAPGLFVTTGMGLALPNFRGSDEVAESSRYGTDVDLDPEIGMLWDLQVGYLANPFFGVGLNFHVGGAWASNYDDTSDSDDLGNKGTMVKGIGHAGAFVRIQYPFDRFVPYLNIAGGYSAYYREWNVYNGNEEWEDIIEQDGDHLSYPHERTSSKDRQFTVALEPGFDIFVKKRSIAVGARAWLPIVGTSDSSLDNVGIMVSVTFTPMWRERPALRPEYEHPASTMEEEMGEEPAAETEAADEPKGATGGSMDEGSLQVVGEAETEAGATVTAD